MLKRVLASFLACAVACTATVTAFAADFPTRTEETKDYLSSMNVKGGGLDEWGLIGLAASGITGDEDTVQEIITTALDDISENEFDGNGKYNGSGAGALAKLIMFLHYQGINPYTFGANGAFAGYDLVAALFNNDYFYAFPSAYSTPYALMVYDTLAVSAVEEAAYKYSREDLVKMCLNLLSDGIDGAVLGGPSNLTGVAGWDMESPYDFESTAMVLRALAPYYLDGSELTPPVAIDVSDIVDECITSIEDLQQSDGGFPYAFFDYSAYPTVTFIDYYNSADAVAQIILAFTALGVNISTANNGSGGASLLDNILSGEYETANAGEFRANSETITDGYDTYITTSSAYLALLSYEKALDGGFSAFSLFSNDMPSVYGNYDYSFYYGSDNGDGGDGDNNGNGNTEISTDNTNKEPVKTGDTFPAAVLMVLATGSVVGMLSMKKAKVK